MGAQFGTIHVLTEDCDEVKRAVETLVSKRTGRFLIAPAIDGWVTVFPENNGQDDGVSKALAEKLSDKTVIHALVHDDDLFACFYFDDGALKDRYNSCPNYFDVKNTEPRGGNAQAFADLLKDSGKVSKLQSLFDADGFTFEGERFEQFAVLLGLPNAVTAYEYLQDGERDGIKRWKQFIHIPDLKAEQTAKRAAKSQAKSDLKRLAKDGILILEKTGPSTGHRLFHSTPNWCIDPITNDVLLAWTGNPIGHAAPTRLFRINSKTGEETPTDVEVSNHTSSMSIDPTGKFLAVGCAYGDWKLELWNIADGKLITEIPQNHAVESVCFSSSGDTLFSFSSCTITLIKMAEPEKQEFIRLYSGGQTMRLHPGGKYLTVEIEGMLSVVHLPTSSLVKTVWILDKPGQARTLLEQFGSQISERFESKLAGHLSADQMTEYRARSARHFLPKQSIRSLAFSPSGKHLICGTTAGVCILNWDQILATPDMTSIPLAAFAEVEPLTREDGMPANQLIYAVPLDATRERVLFTGLEGKIRFFNVREGRVGDLLNPPFRWPLWRLELTPNRTTLVGTTFHPKIKGKPEPPKFQLWNYLALCQKAGLEY
ncbi:MAG TPA: hypothetical protein VFY06_10230 [Verrucomicrobiae bacterium]|nr:hypothetical protein [Verrucomicrobiae bacterium]